jgi:hypothetical protein
MAKPASRQELKDYALRSLGFPVVEINVDDDQLEDRIDEALGMYQQFHYDGTEKIYYAYQVTANNIANKYFDIPTGVVGVTRVFPLTGTSTSTSGGSFNMFDLTYQLRLNELFDFTSADYVYFELAMQHIRTLEMLFIGEKPIRFNRTSDKIYVDLKWDRDVIAGKYVVFEAYRVLDPETYTKIWSEPWLKDYVTALFKRQWGNNLKKFGGVQLPGGIVLNGQQIFSEAMDEVKELEEQLRSTYEEPPEFFMG